jgi:4-diphosphocytidyl-2-C-methyl-D-erythritol kinase
MLTVYAPAKINLILEVLGKDDDGYHQLSSIVQAINLCDVLNFELANEISFKCDEPSLEENNLVTKAAALLKETTKYGKGARIELHKHIPWGVGLGGGSSDAAATLSTLNELWGLNLPVSELVYLASKLGSDVPFFIYGGTALLEGRGEKVTPLPSLFPTYFVLLVPPPPRIPNKTSLLYSKLDSCYFTEGQFVRAALPSLMRGKAIKPPLMFNAFKKLAFGIFPNLGKYKKNFKEAGALSIHLTGSGPALFTSVYKEEEAKQICLYLQKQGVECHIALPKCS